MKYYKVSWVTFIMYYKHGSVVVLAKSKRAAKRIIQEAYPEAEKIKISILDGGREIE